MEVKPVQTLLPPYLDHSIFSSAQSANHQINSPHIINLDLLAALHSDDPTINPYDHYSISILDIIITILHEHDRNIRSRTLDDFLDIQTNQLFIYEWRRPARTSKRHPQEEGVFIWRFNNIVQCGRMTSLDGSDYMRLYDRAWYWMPNKLSSPWTLVKYAPESWAFKWRYEEDPAVHGEVTFAHPGRMSESQVNVRMEQVGKGWLVEKVWRDRPGSLGAKCHVYAHPYGIKRPAVPIRELSRY